MRVNIKMRILLNMLLIVLFLLAVSILAYFTQRQIAQKAGDIEESAMKLEEISLMRLLMYKVIMPANDYLITGDTAEKNNYTKLFSKLDEQINKVKGIRLKDDEKKFLRQFETQLDQIKSKSDAIFSIIDPISSKSGGIIMEEMDAYADVAVDEAEMLHTSIKQEIDNTREVYLRVLSRNRMFLFIFSAIGLLLALYASINVNNMAEGLRKITNQVKEASDNITSTSSEIATAASQQSASAAEQSSAVNETVTTINEIKQTTQTVTERATDVAKMARNSVEISREGQKAVEDAISGVNSIKEQVNNIGDSTLSLNEKTQAISSIIDAVNDIAEQSKMLAFNAAIEASKAGESGKGFAVVASEIRNLAERSQEETKNVHDILDDIQKAANSAVMIAEKGSNEADEGVNLASRAGKNIDQLAETVAQATDAMEQITMSIEQQNLAIEQISQAMQNINQATDETASGTKQTEKATQALNQLAMQMTELVEQYTL